METLVVLAQHRNQYHGRIRSRNHGSFVGSPSRDFRDINCRTFQSGAGILPTPLKGGSSPIDKQSILFSPKTPLPTRTPTPTRTRTPTPTQSVVHDIHSDNQNPKHTKRIAKTSSVPIPINFKHDDHSMENGRGSFNDELFYSELWAGPAYSNSPPPSSLPIPKFSIKPKRTVSLDLPSVSASDIDLLTPVAKSAPPSPTREHKSSQRDFFNGDDDYATKTLRRILNLDMIDG